MSNINKQDVVKLIIQFLRENNLNRSRSTLEKEANQTLNTVESKERFLQDIIDGRWDIVLKQVNQLGIENQKLFNLYEQITLEMIELNEKSTAEMLLRKSNVLRLLNEEYPERYEIMERYLDQLPIEKPQYTTEERRRHISEQLKEEISVTPGSRLLTLLGQSIKWQQLQGILVPEASYDLFTGVITVQQAEEDVFASKPYVSIKFPGKKTTHAECASFSKNGHYLATGSVDGFIEIWNYLTGKLRKDLTYQANDHLMAMDQSVLCVQFSLDNALLASGSSDGKIAIWKVKTGQCQRRIPAAHTEGITSVCFSKDGTQVLSSSYDQTIRIHGLKSGRMLKEFRGHTSFTNTVLFSADNTRILSASSDGTVKIWDVKTTHCLYTVNPQPVIEKGQLNPVGGLGNASVQTIIPIPKREDQYLVCNKTNTLFIISIRGQIIRTLSHNAKSDFITAAVSPQGNIVYGITEDSYMYGFQLNTGAQIGKVKVCDNEVIGIASHPLSNVVVVYDDAGYVFFFKAP
ncbi:WD40-repeat-containing domain protein [Cokeromyces recurvatus]|uniref:WD40-repeat-containing domain protein n=1 Tax=Cokeromyces recurvatus TaxID=90255 RepID=UPI00221EB755|nr:WD40-repeat-containing domain protein [Cokeromyces recurvatus]KAI7903920.1 WD40-repeat-containing domain protein [Cokeromyces recurvatus]